VAQRVLEFGMFNRHCKMVANLVVGGYDQTGGALGGRHDTL
jgi:hypothetical protein